MRAMRVVTGVVLSVALCAPVHALTVDVFTVDGFAITQARNAPVYHIDGIEAFKRTMSDGLPSALEAAKKEVNARMAAQPDAVGKLKRAFDGLLKAKTYGITKVPAIVIEGEYVIYGETDVSDAIAHWRARRQ